MDSLQILNINLTFQCYLVNKNADICILWRLDRLIVCRGNLLDYLKFVIQEIFKLCTLGNMHVPRLGNPLSKILAYYQLNNIVGTIWYKISHNYYRFCECLGILWLTDNPSIIASSSYITNIYLIMLMYLVWIKDDDRNLAGNNF